MSGHYSFRDFVTGILTAHGFVTQNGLGEEIMQLERDDFALEPGEWRWDGGQWIPYVAPALKPSTLAVALDAAIANPTLATFKAALQEWRKQVR